MTVTYQGDQIYGDVNSDVGSLTQFQTSQATVGTSAVHLAAVSLANRSSIAVKVKTTVSTAVVYIGNSNAVTSSTGWALRDGDTIELDLSASGNIWAISNVAGQKVYVIEIGG